MKRCLVLPRLLLLIVLDFVVFDGNQNVEAVTRPLSTSISNRKSSLNDDFNGLSLPLQLANTALKRQANCALTTRRLLEQMRGGALDDSDDEEDEDMEDEDEDDDEDLFSGFDDADGFDDGVAESDFAEDNTIDRMIDAWKKTPPFTKAYLSASFAATMFGYVFNKNQFPKILLLEWKPILRRLQIWRPLTAFLNFGPMGLGYLMTAHFVWTYMSTLERLNHNRPYDFWIMILFGQLSMVVGYPLLRQNPGLLGHNLSTFMVYIWSRYHEGIQVSMFDLFNARAELLPWFFLAQTFFLEGELPILDFFGIVFGHIYHHCKTVGILRAPREVVDWYNGNTDTAIRIRELYKPVSADFEMM